jgi:hypothetical protein
MSDISRNLGSQGAARRPGTGTGGGTPWPWSRAGGVARACLTGGGRRPQMKHARGEGARADETPCVFLYNFD